MMFRPVVLLIVTLTAVITPAASEAQALPVEESTWEVAAEKLQQATVTVRIWAGSPQPKATAAPRPAPPKAQSQPADVTVCSGVCVSEGHIVTAAFAGSDSRIRLTLPGGKQADAKLKVIDEYSGLALLRAESIRLNPLNRIPQQPAVGAELLTAAGWGIEQPLVSRGIVGGIGRKLPGTSYPPLLQCDAVAIQTSSGAGLVNRQGWLVGVVVAAEGEPGRRGWTYAVPVSHVERILRAADEQQGGGVTILKRRRPVVGMVLDQIEEAVVVQRVTTGGPAEKAGIQAGDHILSTDGVAIRSVYQAVLPTIYKQPGDTTAFRVQRSDGVRDVTVILGGGVELASAPADLLSTLMQPKVQLARLSDGAIVANRPAGNVRPLSAAPPLPDDESPATAPTTDEKIALLEKALSRYQSVIEVQQRQLADGQKSQQEQSELIQSLRAELDSLRKSLKPRTAEEASRGNR
jgi:serine protease Do